MSTINEYDYNKMLEEFELLDLREKNKKERVKKFKFKIFKRLKLIEN